MKSQKILSQKSQALIGLISGILMVLIFIMGIFGKISHSRPLHNIFNIFFPLLLIGTIVFAIILSKYKLQPSDELSAELMLKASSVAAYAEICAVIVFGYTIMIIKGSSDFNININGADIVMFGLFLCGVYHASKNAVFLLLDRTPESEEDK